MSKEMTIQEMLDIMDILTKEIEAGIVKQTVMEETLKDIARDCGTDRISLGDREIVFGE